MYAAKVARSSHRTLLFVVHGVRTGESGGGCLSPSSRFSFDLRLQLPSERQVFTREDQIMGILNRCNIARSCSLTLLLLFIVGQIFVTARAAGNTFDYSTQQPDLTGKWQINREKSDNPRDMMRRGDRGPGPGGPGGPPPGGGGFPGGPPPGGGGFPGGGDPPSQEQIERMRARMEEGMRAAEALEILQSGVEITVNETGDEKTVHTQTYFTDGRKAERDTERGKLETRAKWKGQKLVVEMKAQHGGTITRTYELASGGRQLYVTVKIENEGMPGAISVRSVYDKSE